MTSVSTARFERIIVMAPLPSVSPAIQDEYARDNVRNDHVSWSGHQLVVLLHTGIFWPSPSRRSRLASLTTSSSPVRDLFAWCSQLARAAPIPCSAHEDEGQVAHHPLEQAQCSTARRGRLRRFRHCWSHGFSCFVCPVRRRDLSGPPVGSPAVIAETGAYNFGINCTLGKNKMLLLTDWCCADKSEVGFPARWTCFLAAHKVTRYIPRSMSARSTTRCWNSPCSTSEGCGERRSDLFFFKKKKTGEVRLKATSGRRVSTAKGSRAPRSGLGCGLSG